ncbi:hypothetical protein [Roseateles sp. P5_E4]
MGLGQALLAIALLFAQALSHAQVAGGLGDMIHYQAASAMYWADWDELTRLDVAVRAAPQWSRDGALALCSFRHGLGGGDVEQSLAYHEARVAGTLAWAKSRPELALAHAAHLRALIDLAWFQSGSAFANTKPGDLRKDYRVTVDRVQAHANEFAPMLSGDSHVAQVMLEVLMFRKASVDQRLTAARRILSGEPNDECIYRAAIDGLMPRWGGTPQQLEAWVREAMRPLPEAESIMRYARLYNDAAVYYYGQSLFDKTQVRWSLMRQGLERLVAVYPGNYWRNRSAVLACMVKDREVAAAALKTIDKPELDAWGSDGDAERNYEICSRWATQS